MRERAPEHQPDEQVLDTAAGDGEHEATTRERGSFSGAVCTCGWRGPARRARDRARADAAEHARTGGADPAPAPSTAPQAPSA
ncbi:hypothetical protein GCM10009801_81500 [Streptomyces albiaxialis]|uniref:Uncharacterized protein n=1 Tax=Streptomyces albiaxialis TaxID=329523 RepID=A0ABP5IUZ6_9ACTN